MATTNEQCSICNIENDIYECKGCKKTFCFPHLTEHREVINQQFHYIEDSYNSFRQALSDQKNDSNKHFLIQQINQWEYTSIQKIRQTAEQCREKLIKYMNKYIIEIENKFNNLFEQLKQIRKTNKFNEIDSNQFKDKLNKLRDKLDTPSNVSIKEDHYSKFINKIYVTTSAVDQNTKWNPNGITVVGGNGRGNRLDQLARPCSICIDEDQTIYIVDCENHRIVEWKSNARTCRIAAAGNGQGNQMNQLNEPRDVIIDQKNSSLIISDTKNRRVVEWSCQNNTQYGQVVISDIDCWGLAMDKYGNTYVSDYKKHEVSRWKRGEKQGTIVTGRNVYGYRLNFPTYIFIDEYLSLYISDRNNHRIIKWIKDAKEGIVVAGGNGEGDSLKQLSYPEGVVVGQLGQIYVADSVNNRIICWREGDIEGSIIVGGNGKGMGSNQLNYPRGLAFDQEGNLYVAEWSNDRIQKFEIV